MSKEKMFSFGNRKLPGTTAIFNMTSATDCPSRKRKLCKHPDVCYAMKAERMYPTALPFRRRQEEFFSSCYPLEFVDRLLSEAGKKKIDTFRFSEAGDFKSQTDVNKMTAICEILRRQHSIRCYGYTARADLNFDKLSLEASVQGSGFMVTNNFTMVGRPSGDHYVCPGNCRICEVCIVESGKTIEVVKH